MAAVSYLHYLGWRQGGVGRRSGGTNTACYARSRSPTLPRKGEINGEEERKPSKTVDRKCCYCQPSRKWGSLPRKRRRADNNKKFRTSREAREAKKTGRGKMAAKHQGSAGVDSTLSLLCSPGDAPGHTLSCTRQSGWVKRPRRLWCRLWRGVVAK